MLFSSESYLNTVVVLFLYCNLGLLMKILGIAWEICSWFSWAQSKEKVLSHSCIGDIALSSLNE